MSGHKFSGGALLPKMDQQGGADWGGRKYLMYLPRTFHFSMLTIEKAMVRWRDFILTQHQSNVYTALLDGLSIILLTVPSHLLLPLATSIEL